MKYLVCLLALGLSGCARNVDFVKAHAAQRWAELGYKSAVYEGYQWSITGGEVWYTVKRDDSPGVIYTGAFVRWGDELQLYGPKVVSGNQIQLNQKD